MSEINWVPLDSGKRPEVNPHTGRVHVLLGLYGDDGKWYCWTSWYEPGNKLGTNNFYDEIPYEYIINKYDVLDDTDEVYGDGGLDATHWAYLPEGPER